MRRFIKYFSTIIISAFLMLIINNNPTSALYERDKNKVGVSVSKDEVVITVQYQRGFDKGSAYYQWCLADINSINSISDCSNPDRSARRVQYVSAGGDYTLNYISMGDSNYADNNLTTVSFTVSKDKDPVLKNLNEAGSKYVIFVATTFCAVRNSVGDSYNGCMYYDSEVNYSKVEIDISGLANNDRIVIGDIGDDGLENMMQTISNIVYGTVIPIIWAALGLFLIVKGTLLGVQIVKAADEPQVRQEKIGSLKWLVIGVAIAGLAAGAVKVITGYFRRI